jgi:hypothetical protein
MRKSALRLALLTIASLLMFGQNISPTRFVAAAQKTVDPACLEFCQQKLYECILDAMLNGENDKKCISVYRSCLAHCK